MILAGGLGTRLRSVVSDRPKPMALIEGVPFLEILIDSLAGKGVGAVVLLTGYQGDMIEEYFTERRAPYPDIFFSREHAPLGTGGAVKFAERFAADPTLLVNGDTFFDADVGALLDFHTRTGAEVTLSLTSVNDVGRYGAVELDESSRVTGFHEKRSGPLKAGLINAGVSVLSRSFIRRLPEDRAFSMEAEAFPVVARTGRMYALSQERPFFDIGTPESYEAFKRFARERRVAK
jgi:D-glycero-alpha-D-manno-heptose 1-phosphate guanylyltransferase